MHGEEFADDAENDEDVETTSADNPSDADYFDGDIYQVSIVSSWHDIETPYDSSSR